VRWLAGDGLGYALAGGGLGCARLAGGLGCAGGRGAGLCAAGPAALAGYGVLASVWRWMYQAAWIGLRKCGGSSICRRLS
jgi:hypothetical protein